MKLDSNKNNASIAIPIHGFKTSCFSNVLFLCLIFCTLQAYAAFSVTYGGAYTPTFGASPQEACNSWVYEHWHHAPDGHTIYTYTPGTQSYGQCWVSWNASIWRHIASNGIGCPGNKIPDANGNCPPPLYSTDKNNGDSPCDNYPFCGNPINVGTGNKVQREVDYPATGQSGLHFTRVYNSQDMTLYPMGYGWKHSYDRILEITGALVKVPRPDGKKHNFTAVSGSYTSDPDIKASFEALTDAQGIVTGYRYTDEADNIEIYNVGGKLISITSRDGFTQTLDYAVTSANGGDGNSATLDKVTDPFGRSLRFSYGANGLVATLSDPASNLFKYEYDGRKNLIKVIYPDETPTEDTDNPFRDYHYENIYFIHALTGITDENRNRIATWSYDTEARAKSSEHAGGAEQVE